MTILHNTHSAYPDLAPQRSVENRDDWDIEVSDLVPPGHVARFRLKVRSGATKLGRVTFDLPIECAATTDAPIGIVGIAVDDGVEGDSRGNTDGIAQCGERIELYVTLRNRGPSLEIEATLESRDPTVRVLYNATSRYGSIPRNGRAANADDWDLDIAADLKAKHRVAMVLTVRTENKTVRVPFELVVRCP